jgi:hypothetical protein
MATVADLVIQRNKCSHECVQEFGRPWQHRARQGRTGKAMTAQGAARQDREGHDSTGHGTAGQGRE